MTPATTSTALSSFALTGRHVRLVPLGVEHVDGLAAAAAEDRSTYGFTRVPDGLDDTRRYIQTALAGQRSGRELPFVVLRNGVTVGTTRFLDLDVFSWPSAWPPGAGDLPSDARPPSVAEIGSTWYAASAQRTVVNTECKLLLLGHAFDVWHAVRVTLKTDVRNARSRAAIERLGALFEGVRRAHVPATDGTIRDTAYYSIVADEWPAVRDGLSARLDG